MDLPESTPHQNPPPPPPAASAPDSDAQDIQNNKDIAAFSYLWIMSVVVFFLRGKSPFVRYHSKQAMLLFLLSILVLFVPVVSRLLELGVLALMVLGFINAAQGKRKDIPIIGPLSRGEINIRDAWKQIVEGIVSGITYVKSFASSTTSSPPPPPSSPSQPSSPSSPPPAA